MIPDQQFGVDGLRVARILALILLLCGLTGCVRGQVRHDYDLSVRATLIDGIEKATLDGIHVVVKVGDEVIYDGYTDDGGQLEFTYSTVVYRRPGAEKVSILFEVQAGDYGVVEVPVTIGDETNFVKLGRIVVRPGEEIGQ